MTRSSAWGFRERQFPSDSAIEGAARTELRCESADPGAITNHIGPIVEVHDRAPDNKCTRAVGLDALADPGVELDVIREVAGIGEAAPEPAAVDAVQTEHPSLPVVNGAGGVGEGLIVIEKNIVRVDEC